MEQKNRQQTRQRKRNWYTEMKMKSQGKNEQKCSSIHNFFPYRYMERQVFAFHFFDMTRKEEKENFRGNSK